MPKLDYQLKHQLYGRSGSLWEMQADTETRKRVRGIVKQAGNSTTLAQLDQIAAAAIQTDDVLVEDAYFHFVDGNFAIIGRRQTDYNHHEVTLEDGTKVYSAYRPASASSSTVAITNLLARVSDAFLASIARDQDHLPTDRDWYLVPIPTDITPIVIAGRDGVYLTSGIDFLARDGYIVTPDNPADILPIGLVKILSAYKSSPAPNSFTLSAPRDRRGTKWLASYAHRTQSVEAFKRAAAEYAGLYVFAEADVIMAVHNPNPDTWVYICAGAGTVVIRYPHTKLTLHQEVYPGTIISGRFEVVSKSYGADHDPRRLVAEGWNLDLLLDGILPIRGITWDGKSTILIDSIENNPSTGDPLVRMHFGETLEGQLQDLWDWQKRHELQTGISLWEEGLDSPSLPANIDFWDLLETFYDAQLLLILADDHTPVITERLRRFIYEHRPAATTFILGLETSTPLWKVAADSEGFPLVDYTGSYVSTGEEESALLFEDEAMVYGPRYLVHT